MRLGTLNLPPGFVFFCLSVCFVFLLLFNGVFTQYHCWRESLALSNLLQFFTSLVISEKFYWSVW